MNKEIENLLVENDLGLVFNSKGQGIAGSRKLFVYSGGFLYPCEKVMEKDCIGHIDIGIDFESKILICSRTISQLQ